MQSNPGENRFIPMAEPVICGSEWKYVKECLDTGWVSSVGEFVDRFEKDISSVVGVDHAVATTNGTAALHIALKVLGVEADDEVLVSSLSFIAPANAIRYVNAWPIFIDAEEHYWQLDIQCLVDFIERGCQWRDSGLWNKATGRRVRAIMPVHILGHPVDLDPILEIARKYDLMVIEDASEVLGAQYKEQPVGCRGDIACFSFNGNKIITAGGGGMLVSNNGDWADRARYLTTQAKDNSIEYVHREIGYNYRLTNIQAAVGCAQLELLEPFIKAKRGIASIYQRELKDLPGITVMAQAEWASSNWWLYTILVDEKEYGISSRELLYKLKENGIQSRPLWQPLHLSPAHYEKTSQPCPVAEKLYDTALSLPCSVSLGQTDQQRVIENIISSQCNE